MFILKAVSAIERVVRLRAEGSNPHLFIVNEFNLSGSRLGRIRLNDSRRGTQGQLVGGTVEVQLARDFSAPASYDSVRGARGQLSRTT